MSSPVRSKNFIDRSLKTLRLSIALLLFSSAAKAHDIPNARVDRSIQVFVGSKTLSIDYEVSLAELTLTQELKSLIGKLPEGDRETWFKRYGQETGPLDAKGILVAVDREATPLEFVGFDLAIEEHPRYIFHFRAKLKTNHGKLHVQDTNFSSSEGTSRLAIKPIEGVRLRGDDLPQSVDEIAIQPVWKLTDQEERRTRQVEVDFETSGTSADRVDSKASRRFVDSSKLEKSRSTFGSIEAAPETTSDSRFSPTSSLTWLLDRRTGLSWGALMAVAFALGAVHSIQPGHGKTIVAAASFSGKGGRRRAAAVAFIAVITHFASVLLVALGLALTHTTAYGSIHLALARIAGFVIAIVGAWRLGRVLGGYEILHDEASMKLGGGSANVVALGVAGGLVPCWEAVVLVLVADAIGRLKLGLALVAAFSFGMIAILLAVAAGVGWLGERAPNSERFRVGAAAIAAAFLLVVGCGLLQF
jgi:ABC-type nickel/cobalt efflux system permease component RcnA